MNREQALGWAEAQLFDITTDGSTDVLAIGEAMGFMFFQHATARAVPDSDYIAILPEHHEAQVLHRDEWTVRVYRTEAQL